MREAKLDTKTGSSMGDVTQERGSVSFYFLCHENLPFLFGDGGKKLSPRRRSFPPALRPRGR